MPTDHFVIPKYRTLIPHHVKREQYTKTKPKQTFQENANNINSFKKVAILISCGNKIKNNTFWWCQASCWHVGNFSFNYRSSQFYYNSVEKRYSPGAFFVLAGD